MRSRLIAIAVAVAALVAPGAASAAEEFRGYIGLLGDGPTHEASQGAAWTAYFIERVPGNIPYEVCLRQRDSEVKRCWARSSTADGRAKVFVARFVNDVGGPGRWRAKWFVDGKKVDGWKFRVLPEGV